MEPFAAALEDEPSLEAAQSKMSVAVSGTLAHTTAPLQHQIPRNSQKTADDTKIQSLQVSNHNSMSTGSFIDAQKRGDLQFKTPIHPIETSPAGRADTPMRFVPLD